MASDIVVTYVYRLIPREPHQETLASSPLVVMFTLDTAAESYFFDVNNRRLIVEALTPPHLVSRRFASFPVSDSLGYHIQEFAEILTSMGIPPVNQSQLLEWISIQVADGSGRARSSFTVQVLEIIYYPEADYISRAVRESIEQSEVQTIPATKSSIDALERMVFDGLASRSMDCTICLEEIEGGVEAIKMPCSHVYHANCIVKWLETSHFCPLCRYRMPCDTDFAVSTVVN